VGSINILKEDVGTLVSEDALELGWDPFASQGQDSSYTPRFDICETSDRLIIRADLPGVLREDLRVTLTGTRVVISGWRALEGDTAQGTCYSAERGSGGFTRIVLLPHSVEPGQAVAELCDGVLHVVLPRVGAPHPTQPQQGAR
jgi:HSP20 family protein